MQVFEQRIESALSERNAKGLTRSLKAVESNNTVCLTHDEQEYLNFSSNDYLGLASDKELTKAWQEGLDLYGNGSGASPLVTGFSSAHQKLEETLCQWLGFERAILFGSGFSANQALLFSLLTKQDLLLQDKLNHASLIEAGTLSPATMKRFKHNDVTHLKTLLTQSALVVTEGVFSMDGDLAPLEAIKSAIEQNAWLAVDDAHGVGVLGNKGKGSCDYAGIQPEILVVTFGKAFGLSGAAIICSNSVGDYLTQFAKHHVYSTAIPPSQAVALSKAAEMIETHEWRREKLAELSQCFDEQLQDCEGYRETITPIKPFILGSADKALSVSNQLRQQGFWVTAIRPPTVPAGSARLRITLTAKHNRQDVIKLADALKQAVKGM
ncbi:8-amino-7-oxononanoate synthase [Vibrio tubiashii]|uniref:8-amino-7-oxononanoate synthase n=1 Tax=Vibrio tubiashii ATCC 19109 TaxID=1051646 RepID=F9TA44_9VIBR|nr:8-amino-7-oxononanoate synthase [Vibrio tubiashii]AIW13722.1 8-amino-7-oxononanoate synthase [Vibrio tubiashii ATCC 19109]EGU50458.1 8-amino-7-oxononanoate synthase [Vibrio tubiashii ATCC 19109]EIF01871.1 8-amino-7-oxononanoate synthase [Vibrio tubiashii NCIMB 1337 = ATCC 19106]